MRLSSSKFPTASIKRQTGLPSASWSTCSDWHIYLLSGITDILHKRSGYKFLTKLDVSMMFYTFELDEASCHLCVIVTPFGKYQYLRLPMGIKQSPNIARQIMEEVLYDILETDPYIDDIGVFNMSLTDHMNTLEIFCITVLCLVW
jgi:hypothetical protein